MPSCCHIENFMVFMVHIVRVYYSYRVGEIADDSFGWINNSSLKQNITDPMKNSLRRQYTSGLFYFIKRANLVNSFSQFHVECIQMNSTKLQIKLHISFRIQNNSEIDEHNRPKFIWMWALRNTHITYFSSLRFLFFFFRAKQNRNEMSDSFDSDVFLAYWAESEREKSLCSTHYTQILI